MNNRTVLNKLVGKDSEGTYIFVHELHWNGVSCNYLVPMTEKDIEDRVNNTDPDDYKEFWVEAVKNGDTEDSLVGWFEDLQTNCDGYFLGHDDSYVSNISKEDWELIEQDIAIDVETFECIGGGTSTFRNMKFVKIFNQEVYDTAVEHELTIEAEQKRDSEDKGL